jgi:hypothetical protein
VPKTKRDLLKRQAAHAYHNCNLASEHLYNLILAFEGVHNDKADALKVAVVGIATVKDVIRAFWGTCWGPMPDDVEKWRNVGTKD